MSNIGKSGIPDFKSGSINTLADRTREAAKKAIIDTLRFHHGNRGRAAKDLGIHRNTLQRLILKLEIDTQNIPDGRSVRP